MKRRLQLLIAALIVYANLSMVLSGIGVPVPLLPGTWEGFALFGIFSSYELENHEVIIEGQSGPGPSQWERLDIAEFVPFVLPERDRRLNASRAQSPGQRAFLARKIRERHNRLHPDRPVSAVRLVQLRWPRTSEQYQPLEGQTVERFVLFDELGP